MSKQKKNNGFKTLLLLMGLGALVGCTKPEDPNQNQNNPPQNDSIPETPVTPVKPYDTIHYDWSTAQLYAFTPHRDTIRKHLAQPGLKQLTLHLFKKNEINQVLDRTTSTYRIIRISCDSIQSAIGMDSTKIKLYGTMKFKQIGEPGYMPADEEEGIIALEKAQYLMQHGMNIITNSKQH